jgi:plastocyanin
LLPAAQAARPPARIQVVAKEFYFILSRSSVAAGPAIVELVNFGQDAHDLRIERIGSHHVAGTPVLQPGSYYDLKLTLVPGTYELWCSIANHRALGMHAEFFVVRRDR